MKKIFIYIFLCFGSFISKGQNGIFLNYKVYNGDTVFVSNIRPAYILDGNKRDMKKYYRLVYNFSKVYPFAIVGKKMKKIVDSTIVAQHMTKRQKEKYVNQIQKQLLQDFGGKMRHLTISQGALLIKLVDRETGTAGYSLIKDYKNAFAAACWQGLAKLFDNDLRSQYDPKGADKDTEFLVKLWQQGSFIDYYYSMFWEYPTFIEIPSKYK